MIQNELLSRTSIVGNHMARTVGTYQKLMLSPVSVFTPDVLAGNSEDKETTFDLKWNLTAGFRECQLTSRILHLGQTM